MKVTYARSGGEGYTSKAYLEDEPLADGSHVGTDKYTELPVHLRWNDAAGTWVQVCVRIFTLLDVYNERWEEQQPRPPCSCW